MCAKAPDVDVAIVGGGPGGLAAAAAIRSALGAETTVRVTTVNPEEVELELAVYLCTKLTPNIACLAGI